MEIICLCSLLLRSAQKTASANKAKPYPPPFAHQMAADDTVSDTMIFFAFFAALFAFAGVGCGFLLGSMGTSSSRMTLKKNSQQEVADDQVEETAVVAPATRNAATNQVQAFKTSKNSKIHLMHCGSVTRHGVGACEDVSDVICGTCVSQLNSKLKLL